ncbi:putative E3 ubiquitin-protein ligase ARI8 [Senna tora]|uniref:Putative E3 ubiquitin-protein ligase ARI8 n=1 Tax=Senna tora TaxID=362788 RepID=A0A834X5E5_9FABA|nr:putative E3 ubiquitin-protein ligase ARI8 [Senna tora]
MDGTKQTLNPIFPLGQFCSSSPHFPLFSIKSAMVASLPSSPLSNIEQASLTEQATPEQRSTPQKSHPHRPRLEKLSDLQCQPKSQLKFITKAWLQITKQYNSLALLHFLKSN